MKQAIFVLALLIAAAGPASTAFAQKDTISNKQTKEKTTKKYSCPMHPEVVSDKQGKCPKCGMKLEVVKNEKKNKK